MGEHIFFVFAHLFLDNIKGSLIEHNAYRPARFAFTGINPCYAALQV